MMFTLVHVILSAQHITHVFLVDLMCVAIKMSSLLPIVGHINPLLTVNTFDQV